jgi:NAD(P)H-hydrate repair Nnr-like enzyme with NAD(P)H-hydrate dehydratase domain
MKVSELAIDPVLGTGQEVATSVREFIIRRPVPLVIDADALNALAKVAYQGASIAQSRTSATNLTPHPGEMGGF